MKETLRDVVLLIRALGLLAGLACLVAFWIVSDNVWQEIAWGVYATALFALVAALKD